MIIFTLFSLNINILMKNRPACSPPPSLGVRDVRDAPLLSRFIFLFRKCRCCEIARHALLFRGRASDVNANEARRSARRLDSTRISLTASATIRKMFTDVLFLCHDVSPSKSWCMAFLSICLAARRPTTASRWIIASYTCSACQFIDDIFQSLRPRRARGFAPHETSD